MHIGQDSQKFLPGQRWPIINIGMKKRQFFLGFAKKKRVISAVM